MNDRVSDDAEVRDSFEAVIHREAPRLWRLAFVILRDAGDAEDAVQETAIKAWRHWDPGRENTQPWLTRICVNQCLDSRRSLRRRGHAQLTDLAMTPTAGPSDPDLARAYEGLSARQRAVIALHYQYGHTLDECARLMGCRPGTARSHLARALATLRSELDDA